MVRMWIALFVATLLVRVNPANPQESKPDGETREGGCDLSLHLSPEGGVELILRQKDKVSGKSVEKIHKAGSIEEFRKKYPEVAQKYRIDRILQSDDLPPLDSGDLNKTYEEWKLKFDGRWFWDRSHSDDIERWFHDLPKPLQTDDLRQWFEEQRAAFEKFRRLHPASNPDRGAREALSKSPPSLGALIAPVGDTLASQLGFEKPVGIIFAAVQKDGLADRSGLRKNDIALKINGKSIPDTAFFQKEVSSSTQEFVVEILRHGKRETITVQFDK